MDFDGEASRRVHRIIVSEVELVAWLAAALLRRSAAIKPGGQEFEHLEPQGGIVRQGVGLAGDLLVREVERIARIRAEDDFGQVIPAVAVGIGGRRVRAQQGLHLVVQSVFVAVGFGRDDDGRTPLEGCVGEVAGEQQEEAVT